METEKKYVYLHRLHVLAILYILISLASKILKTPEIALLFLPVAAVYLTFHKKLDSILFRKKIYFITLVNVVGSTIPGPGLGDLDVKLAILKYLGTVSALLLAFILFNSVFMLVKAFKMGTKDILSYDPNYRGGHEAVRKHLLLTKIGTDEVNIKRYLYIHRVYVLTILYILIDLISNVLKTHDLTLLFILVLVNYLFFPEIFDPIFQFRKGFYLATLVSGSVLTLFEIVNGWPETPIPKFEYLGTVSTILLFFILFNSAFMLMKVFKVEFKDLFEDKKDPKEIKSPDP